MSAAFDRPGYIRKSRTRISMVGFTLIELLITLAILGLLASLVIPVSRNAVQRSQEQDLRRALHEIRSGLDAYKKAGEDGRIPKIVGASGYPKSLSILVDGVIDQTDPMHKKIFFLRRVPRDPMNPDTSISAEQSWGKRSYESEADDPKEGDDVFDVFSLSSKIGLNGIPYSKW